MMAIAHDGHIHRNENARFSLFADVMLRSHGDNRREVEARGLS